MAILYGVTAMSPLRRFLRIVYGLIIVVAIGTAGYMIIEGWSFLDAIYMTVITLSTVGYSEVGELSSAGRIFSIILIVLGVGVMLYTLTAIVQYIVEGNLANILWRHRMNERIAKLRDHIILCGYGRVGTEVARSFAKEGVPFVIIDPDPEAVSGAALSGYLCLQGSGTDDSLLKESGIEKARGLVAAAGDDATNVFITLSAKGLRPDLFITARATAPESDAKLKRAGADRTISPHAIGGRRLAMLALRPLVVDFVDTALHSRGHEFVLENVEVGQGSPVAGQTISEGQRRCSGATILAVKKHGGTLLTSITGDTLLEHGDELVIVGTREQLRAIEGAT